MARLVGVSRDTGNENDDVLLKHQLPVYVDDMRTMIVEFEDPCATHAASISSSASSGKMSLKQFREKVLSLNNEELRAALNVECEHFNNTLLQLVPCVGCRRSVEKLYGELSCMVHPALHPLTVTPSFSLTVHNSYLTDIKLMYRLLITDRQKVRQTIEMLTKCRKSNKRCALHSLDVHVCRTKMSWDDLWDLMSEDCRDECCVVESDSLLDMLETYLEKHRFCTECRAKVMKAYNLLVDEGDKSQEKGYNPLVYQGLRYCPTEQHLHLKPSVQYLNALIDRAEPELMGGRERHAKTLDVAQGEVLTCLGLYMHDRLHRMVMALRTLQTTFQLLYCAGVVAIYTNFEEALERKHGLSDSLERLCAELQDSAANPSHKHQQTGKGCGLNGHAHNGAGKKGKKKPAKSASASSVSKTSLSKALLDGDNECLNCVRRQSACDADAACAGQRNADSSHSPVIRPSPLRQRSYSLPRRSSGSSSSNASASAEIGSVDGDRRDGGQARRGHCVKCAMLKKAAGAEDDDECSSGSSCCHDAGYCSQELSPGGGSPASGSCRLINMTQREMLTTLSDGRCGEEARQYGNDRGLPICSNGKLKQGEAIKEYASVGHDNLCSCTLLNMLEENDKENSSINEEPLISPEDVKWFQENQTLVSKKRRALRERLIRQFRDMQERMQAPTAIH